MNNKALAPTIILFTMAIIIISIFATITILISNNGDGLTIVNSVDPNRYAGKWYLTYEITGMYGIPPFGFDSSECENQTATYSIKLDGSFKVKNCCDYNGEYKCVDGTAEFKNKNKNGHLYVSFFPGIRSDYVIIGLDDQYKWSVVTVPEKDRLWVLCKEKELTNIQYAEIFEIIAENGIDQQKIVKTS